MKPGSVIVDLAAEQGGNCELTEPGQVVVKHGVTIIGYTDLPSRLARQSSTLYATNLLRLTEELCKAKDGTLNVNMDDEVIRGTDGDQGRHRHLAAAAAQALRRAGVPQTRGGRCRRSGCEGGRTWGGTARGSGLGRPHGIDVWRRRRAVLVHRRVTRRRRSSPTSPSSCSPASWATWWCGTSRRRCTRR